MDTTGAVPEGKDPEIGDVLADALRKTKAGIGTMMHMANKRTALEAASRIFNVDLLTERGFVNKERLYGGEPLSVAVLGAVTNLADQLTDWLEDDSA